MTLALAFTASTAMAVGIVVEELAALGAAAKAGIKVDDIILSWDRRACPPAHPDPASGELIIPLDLNELQTEQAPRGTLVLHGLRGGQAFSVDIPPGSLGVGARPVCDEADLVAYRTALRAAESGDLRLSIAQFEALSEKALETGEVQKGIWFLHRLAGILKGADTTENEFRVRQKAITMAENADLPSLHAWLLHLGAERLRHLGRFDEAAEYHQQALEIRQELAEESLGVALSFHQQGVLAWVRGDPKSAEKLWQRGMDIRLDQAPGSLVLAKSLNNLGFIAAATGDFDRSEDLNRRCLLIRERLAPGSLDVAQSLTNLGFAASYRGDEAANEQFQRQALVILEHLAPNSLEVATSVFNLGGAAYARGDLTAADQHFRRALEIRQNLEEDGLAVAGVNNALAAVSLQRHDFDTAEIFNRRALEIRVRLAPDGLDTAESLLTQGLLATEKNNLSVAEDSLRQAAAMYERAAADGIDTGICLSDLGRVVFRLGRIDEAELLLRRAVAILERSKPQSSAEADALYQLGILLSDRGRRTEALELMMRAVDDVEAQTGRLGGATEYRAGFRERYMDIYRDSLHLHMLEGHPEEAFAILERSRSNTQLAMLAERDIMFSADIPVELERRRRKAAAEFDRVSAEIGQLRAWDRASGTPGQRGVGGLVPSEEPKESEKPDGAELLFSRLQELRHEQAEIRAEIRNTSPRLASLVYPQPLDLEGTLDMLDPGTVLLAYSVGERSSYLFVVEVDRSSLSVFPLGANEAELRMLISQYRARVQQGQRDDERLTQLARELSDTLLGPGAESIARADRLVIAADGPLHLLPFAALTDPLSPESGRFLIERKSLTIVASATVFAEMKQRRRKRPNPHVVGFGDPVVTVDGQGISSSELSWIGQRLGPLPGSRKEVEALGRVFGKASTIWIGTEATEERVKKVGTGAAILHMAVHGVVNENQPMESALVLATPATENPGRDNGLLQVWEVFEQLRLDADLVVLSACDTALGREVSGEGLMGLSQAFSYAGSRAVLASLWGIADASTAELMQRFYDNLRSGKTTSQALRAAQLELIRAPLKCGADDESGCELDFRHPYYWAAFQLMGDWQ